METYVCGWIPMYEDTGVNTPCPIVQIRPTPSMLEGVEDTPAMVAMTSEPNAVAAYDKV